ncbi:MAG: hypothetical protein HRT58_05640 [Crocinitomicaceae bacterium]|nr:hypothetical protein [Flavobacteriales bacterium]NQZ35123.1 hypothetical protein [Crocinitomicaceae bacterium]
MNKLLYVLSLFLLFSCSGESTEDTDPKEQPKNDTLSVENPLELDTLNIKSDYKMEDVDVKERKEFKKNLANIEKKYGIQWDFCTCVLANDSLDKAVKNPAVSDLDMDQIFKRFDVVAEKCKAFQIQNPNQTPEERARHERKVSNCLRGAK